MCTLIKITQELYRSTGMEHTGQKDFVVHKMTCLIGATAILGVLIFFLLQIPSRVHAFFNSNDTTH